MKLLAIILTALLTGCAYQMTSAGDIREATRICKTHGGINHITVNFVGDEYVRCQDEYGTILHRSE